MAGVQFVASKNGIASTTALHTVLQLLAAANQRVLIKEIVVSFDGTNTTDTPVLVQVTRQTTAGAANSALTLVKVNAGDDETLTTTGTHTNTGAEPTGSENLFEAYVHPQGRLHIQRPPGMEFVVKGGERIGVRITAAQAHNVAVSVLGEE